MAINLHFITYEVFSNILINGIERTHDARKPREQTGFRNRLNKLRQIN